MLLRDGRLDTDLILREEARRLQVEAGESLVDAIWRAGRSALVHLGMQETPSDHMDALNLDFEAVVLPAERDLHRIRIPVRHFEYFPMDWACAHCGSLVDGLAHPRKCPHCGAGKPKEFW
jgi:hypothetical protein